MIYEGFMQVPSTHSPNYEVDPAVNIVPINGLARVEHPWQRYTIIGAGKTGLDALLYLLAQVLKEIQFIADRFWIYVTCVSMCQFLGCQAY